MMSDSKKADNKAEELVGKVKEGVGRTVGNKSMESEGRAEQGKANVKQAGEKIKDAFKS